jgi:hypothetical protein
VVEGGVVREMSRKEGQFYAVFLIMAITSAAYEVVVLNVLSDDPMPGALRLMVSLGAVVAFLLGLTIGLGVIWITSIVQAGGVNRTECGSEPCESISLHSRYSKPRPSRDLMIYEIWETDPIIAIDVEGDHVFSVTYRAKKRTSRSGALISGSSWRLNSVDSDLVLDFLLDISRDPVVRPLLRVAGDCMLFLHANGVVVWSHGQRLPTELKERLAGAV